MTAQPTARDLTHFFDLLDDFGAPAATPDDAEFLYRRTDPAGMLRLANLRRYLELMAGIGTRTLLVGEAPGWRGCTITGISFMAVKELLVRPGPITGNAEGDGFLVPGHPAVTWEASSTVVWKALARWTGPLPVAWPIYPNHPFIAGSPQGNRTPRPAEVRAGAPLTFELIHAFGIEQVVAVGKKALGALELAGIDAVPVRHPAQGGAALFTEQLLAFNATLVGDDPRP